MSATEPLPCPFCGALPIITADHDTVTIECRTVNCPASPITSGDLSIDAYKSLQAWNTRARPALDFTDARERQAVEAERKQFPVLGSGGAKVDYQLVADHGEQARKNHYQSVDRLAERGGLGWCELFAVLHNRPWAKMDPNEAMIACRSLEARYLAAIRAQGGKT